MALERPLQSPIDRADTQESGTVGSPANASGEETGTLTITLPVVLLNQLDETAARLGISPQTLVRISLQELLKGHEARFQEAADHVFDKNAELYRRLA
jgi:hypothetical protein